MNPERLREWGRQPHSASIRGRTWVRVEKPGAVTTNDESLAQRIRMVRDHGQAETYYHEMEAYNGRLDAIQAGILRIKPRHLTAWNEKRRECARRYQELFGSGQKELGLPL